MRVPGGEQLVRGGVGGPGQDLGQRCAAGRRGAGDVVGVHDVQHAFQRTQDLVAARQFMGSSCMSPLRVQTSCWRSQTVWFSSAMAILPSRYCGSVPAVALSPYGVAAKLQPCATSGLAAAST